MDVQLPAPNPASPRADRKAHLPYDREVPLLFLDHRGPYLGRWLGSASGPSPRLRPGEVKSKLWIVRVLVRRMYLPRTAPEWRQSSVNPSG